MHNMVKQGRIGFADGIMVHKSGQGRIWPNEIRSRLKETVSDVIMTGSGLLLSESDFRRLEVMS